MPLPLPLLLPRPLQNPIPSAPRLLQHQMHTPENNLDSLHQRQVQRLRLIRRDPAFAAQQSRGGRVLSQPRQRQRCEQVAGAGEEAVDDGDVDDKFPTRAGGGDGRACARHLCGAIGEGYGGDYDVRDGVDAVERVER